MSGQYESSYGNSHADGVPLCTRCLRPHSPHQYYCAHCGAAVGQYTAYIPYVDIPFFANFYGRLWRRAWFERGVSLISRAFSMLIILLAAPVMLIGLPFAILKRRRERADGDRPVSC